MSTTTLPRPGGLRTRGGMRSLVRGRTEDPAWARVAFVALLAATAVAYLWNLTASGDANSFYAAAVQAGTKSWKAFFFGSLDSSNFITVDKPPASLWVMALSGRIFGFSSASMLVPQVLEGVLAVGLLAAAVKRWFGSGAGLLAGAMLAVTPVAALMFRFNNPDALLVCLLVASAYCLVRALEGGSTRWMIGVGTLIGFAFLAKMMQAFLVVPGFALVYLVAAPTTLRRRVLQLLAGGAAMIASAGWWVAIVGLWPAASRPMIDGSSDNSILNLIVGYNGLGRLTGSGGGPAAVAAVVGISAASPACCACSTPDGRAGVVAAAGGAARRCRGAGVEAACGAYGPDACRNPALGQLARGQRARVQPQRRRYPYVLHGGACARDRGARGDRGSRRMAMARPVRRTRAARAGRGHDRGLVDRAARPYAVMGALARAVGRCCGSGRGDRPADADPNDAPPQRGGRGGRARRVLAGPVAYSAQTIGTAHTGSTPSAGPSDASGGFGGGPAGGGFGRAGGFSARGLGEFPSGNAPPGGGEFARGGSSPGGGGLGGDVTSSALVAALKSGASGYRWAAATSGSQSAAALELATGGVPVMAIGGFSGQGGNLSLAQFEAYVKAGDIHYYIANGDGFGGGPGGGSSAITSWVKAHYRAGTIGGQTVYDLSQPLES